MKLKTSKNKKIQNSIAKCLKTGLPLAGLLASLTLASGCDKVFFGEKKEDINSPQITDTPMMGDIRERDHGGDKYGEMNFGGNLEETQR